MSGHDVEDSRHESFYFEDRTVVFSSERWTPHDLLTERIVVLPRWRINYSVCTDPHFKDIVLYLSKCGPLPIPAGGQSEGTSDSNPIRLEGVALEDFERFLCILYPPYVPFRYFKLNDSLICRRYGVTSLTALADWQSVIKLASQWEFDDIRAMALRELQKLDLTPAQKIALSHRYEIRPDWRMPALIFLCEQPDPPSFDDAQILGLQNVLLLSKAREKLRSRNATMDHACYGCRAPEAFELACKTCGTGLETFATRRELPDVTPNYR